LNSVAYIYVLGKIVAFELLWLDVSLGVLSDGGPVVVVACDLVQCKMYVTLAQERKAIFYAYASE